MDDVSGVAAALVDLDHDGDLDLVLPAFGLGSAPPPARPAGHTRVLLNNGKGVFTDATVKSDISGSGIVGIVPTDFDERRDVDLLFVSESAPLALFRNMRDGGFRDSAREAMLPGGAGWTAVAAGDLNKDGRADFFLGRADGPGVFALSDGRSGYAALAAPAVTAGARAAALFDYDNDGLLDLLVVTGNGVHLLRNAGTRWIDVGSAALPASGDLTLPAPAAGRALAVADFDNDGDADIVLASNGGPCLWRNDGGNHLPSLALRLAGRVSNRSGVGANIEMRAGSLRDLRETSAVTPSVAPADVLFGLGSGRHADAVRVLWPSGILQAEVLADPTVRLALTEVDRKPSSCPFLFAWNGQGFTFVTDFLGGGELGYWEAPGVRNVPDPDEYVRIAGDSLQPLAGRYQLRVTNELEEALFLDALRLHVVDHRAGIDVYPLEGLFPEPRRGLRLIAVEDTRAPASATDDQGRDVLPLVVTRDHRAPEDFGNVSIRGYGTPHALILSPQPGADADALLLTGWTDYAFSSDNLAAHQNGLALSGPTLEMRRVPGPWHPTGLAIGVPIGRPQTVVVDLRSIGGARGRQFRLATNMRIHWDQVRFARVVSEGAVTRTVLDVTSAVLRQRGFSRPVAAGGDPLALYDYDQVVHTSPWKQLTGRYTAEGEVRELLGSADDRFLVAAPGDDIAVAFDATELAAPRPGWRRTFLLQADGFSKEMDLHSASPDQVGPLPYHAMREYPPVQGRRPAALGSPDTTGTQAGRRLTRTIPLLESVLIGDAASTGDDPSRNRPARKETRP
jgi:FG-GAP-like repeat